MGAPEHVPVPATNRVRAYSSPPRRARSWMPDRPGELVGGQPDGDGLGTPGPDQGYALTLADRFRGKVKLVDGESERDVLAGAGAVAMKRSGLLGRAPLMEDVEVGLMVWGFLDSAADPELVELRRDWFAEVHSAHHDEQRQRLVDAVGADVLRQSLDDIGVAHAEDWRELLELDRA